MAIQIKSNVGRVGATNRATVAAGQAGAQALAQGAQAIGQIGAAVDSKQNADAALAKRQESAQQAQRLRENNYRRSEILNDYGAKKNTFMQAEQQRRGKDAEGGVQRFNEFQLAYNQKLKIADPDLKRTIDIDIKGDAVSSTNGIQMRENGILRGVRKQELVVRQSTHRENIVTQANNVDWTIASNTFVDDLLINSADVNDEVQGGLALEDGTSLEVAAQKAGMGPGLLNEEYPRIAENPFDSDRKYMSTINNDISGQFMVFAKGATDRRLPLCTRKLEGGTVQPMTDDDIQIIHKNSLSSLRPQVYVASVI